MVDRRNFYGVGALAIHRLLDVDERLRPQRRGSE